MVHRRSIDGDQILLGNQRALWGNAMTWWDHETGSLWSQPMGEAILGPLKGTKLTLMPSTLTTWAAWRSAHPGTVALDVHAWSTGFDLADMTIVVDFGTETVAYDIPALRDAGVVNDVVAGVEIAVAIDPAHEDRWAVFSRRLDESTATFVASDVGLLDTVSGTVFGPFLGVGRDGPLADQNLDKLPAFTSFPEDVETFFPDARRWEG
jgi:hypothetical protein